jgi:hypothetical protein
LIQNEKSIIEGTFNIPLRKYFCDPERPENNLVLAKVFYDVFLFATKNDTLFLVTQLNEPKRLKIMTEGSPINPHSLFLIRTI